MTKIFEKSTPCSQQHTAIFRKTHSFPASTCTNLAVGKRFFGETSSKARAGYPAAVEYVPFLYGHN
jgi:hypothetical protein